MFAAGGGGGGSYTGDGIQGYMIFSSGGQTSTSWGIAISYQGLVINVIAQTKISAWGPLSYTASAAGWYYVTITWHSVQGLFFYINGKVVQNIGGAGRDISVTTSTFNNFYFGRANDIDGAYGNFIMDEFYFYNTFQPADWVFNLYLTYLSK